MQCAELGAPDSTEQPCVHKQTHLIKAVASIKVVHVCFVGEPVGLVDVELDVDGAVLRVELVDHQHAQRTAALGLELVGLALAGDEAADEVGAAGRGLLEEQVPVERHPDPHSAVDDVCGGGGSALTRRSRVRAAAACAREPIAAPMQQARGKEGVPAPAHIRILPVPAPPLTDGVVVGKAS